jgi:cell division protein ZipA
LAAELRWVLLGLSLPLLAGIWWWTARRTGQAPGNPELRESTPPLDPRHSDGEDKRPPATEPRDWGVPPFEPLSIRTANFDGVPILDGPMMVSADPGSVAGFAPAPMTASAPAPSSAAAPMSTSTPAPSSAASPMSTSAPTASSAAAPMSTPAAATAPPSAGPASRTLPGTAEAVTVPAAARPTSLTGSSAEDSDRLAAVAPPAPNAAEQQRIVTIRVCALGEQRWSGIELLAALELHGLAFGRYQVFHRKHADGRSLFCVASLIEPGTFDVAEMPGQEFRGVTLFAVLPGPIVPLETVDELFRTARGLAEELSGMVQDAKGMPLSPQRAAAVREDVARFQASLSGH